jgi:hypothetical protein
MFGKDLKKIRELPFSTALRAGLRVTHPSLLSVLIQDRLGLMRKPGQSRLNLDAAIKWLCRAQDVCGGGGVSAGYSFIRGWHPPYPETTGFNTGQAILGFCRAFVWGAKFLADSLMLEERVMADVERAVRSGEPLTLSEARSQVASAAN